MCTILVKIKIERDLNDDDYKKKKKTLETGKIQMCF
jgi:hypothetical protein